jgi:ATP-binding cassette, subfamily B, bacterial PglK
MSRYFTVIADIATKLYSLAAPYSRKKPLFVLAITLLQGVFQVVGVTSIFPFLAVASDPSQFRNSHYGELLLSLLPKMTDAALLITAGIFSISMLVAANAVSLAGDYVRASYGQGFAHWLRLRLLSQIVSQPWSYFLRSNTGILLKKANSDVMSMTMGVLFPLLEGFARLVTLVFLAATLIIVDPLIACAAFLLISLYYASVFSFLKSRYSKASGEQKNAYRGVMKEAQQLLGGIKPIKVQNVEASFVDRYATHSKTLATVNTRLPIYYHAPKYILEPIAFGGIVAVVIIQAGIGKDFASILPTLGIIGLAGYRMLPAAQILYSQISQIATQRHALEEVYDEFIKDGVACAGNTANRVASKKPAPIKWAHEIRLENISFAYPGAKNPVLDRFSLTIKKGTSVGIIGPTGSGKSTLIDLILGLHQPTGGGLLVDGKNLDPSDMRAWQAGIGYVPQDVFLIDDTLASNIALGLSDDAIDLERLREVASAARILDFIENDLNDGFDTMVGERGIRLSGGQRQRIAIARALYRRPSLLILDEATSALDNETEAEVTEAINSLQGSVTMLVVAHRLSTVERCDKIINLMDGS